MRQIVVSSGNERGLREGGLSRLGGVLRGKSAASRDAVQEEAAVAARNLRRFIWLRCSEEFFVVVEVVGSSFIHLLGDRVRQVSHEQNGAVAVAAKDEDKGMVSPELEVQIAVR